MSWPRDDEAPALVGGGASGGTSRTATSGADDTAPRDIKGTATTREKVAALMPLVERMNRSHCWIKTPDGPRRLAEPFTEFMLAEHCAGRKAYGLCPIAPGESTTRVALLDFDSHDGATDWPGMVRTARDVMDAAALLFGLKGVAFRSGGGRGVHVYFLFDQAQDAHSVREALKEVLVACDLKPGTAGVAAGEIEAYPKQSRVKVGDFGSMAILPLARKSVLLDDDGNPLPRDAIVSLSWPMSESVPFVAQAPKPERVIGSSPDVDRLRSALAAIPNDDVSYDDWRNTCFAVHEATGGSDEGLEVFREWSARSSKHDDDFLENRVWCYAGRTGGDVITADYVLKTAERHGWPDPAVMDDFDEMPPAKVDTPPPLPNFARNKSGEILSTDDNVTKALRRADVCGYRIGFDGFRDELMLAPEGTDEWRPFTDADYTRISIVLERGGFKTTSSDRLRSCVRLVADEYRFDSAMVWLDSLQWDGVPRVARFLAGYAGTEAERRAALKYDASVYTVNYENLPWLVEHFGDRWPFRTVVVDESRKLKSFRLEQGGKRTASLAKVAHTKVKRMIQLTGAPAPNGLKDLYGQAWFLDAGQRLGRTYSAFEARWFSWARRPKDDGSDRHEIKQVALPFAQEQIQAALSDVCLRVDAADWFDLEKPIPVPVFVDLPPKARAIYKEMEKEMYAQVDDRSAEAFNAAARTQKCLQIANGAVYVDPLVAGEEARGPKEWREAHDVKLQALESIVEEAGGSPVLVAYHFKSDLARLVKAFPKARVLSDPAQMREFKTGKYEVGFGHPASMGHGVDGLQDHCHRIAFFGHWWDMDQRNQIIGRVGPVRQYQAGHKRPVYIYDIIARDTVDELVIARHETKREVQDLLLEAMKGKR